MLRLVIASIALGLTWSWLRAEFSRAIEAKAAPRRDALLVRGGAFAISLVWFLISFGGVFGKLLVWGAVLAIVVAGAWLLLGRGGGGGTAPEGDKPAGDDEPPDSASA
jgi:hypothetical protein